MSTWDRLGKGCSTHGADGVILQQLPHQPMVAVLAGGMVAGKDHLHTFTLVKHFLLMAKPLGGLKLRLGLQHNPLTPTMNAQQSVQNENVYDRTIPLMHKIG